MTILSTRSPYDVCDVDGQNLPGKSLLIEKRLHAFYRMAADASQWR